MKPLDILIFLMPRDFFQWAFLSVILGLSLWNVWGVKRKANAVHWENNWNNDSNDNEDDDLDSEHGSVIEISQAVATKPEKLADIMPGLLLIIGLLGTFLGLGLALNKASEILANAKTAGMDSAMSNMMEMMQGLGTKFKTSTWGIMGFLIFKAWVSRNGFEDSRLRWSIKKMKTETNARRAEAKNIELLLREEQKRQHEEHKQEEAKQYDGHKQEEFKQHQELIETLKDVNKKSDDNAKTNAKEIINVIMGFSQSIIKDVNANSSKITQSIKDFSIELKTDALKQHEELLEILKKTNDRSVIETQKGAKDIKDCLAKLAVGVAENINDSSIKTAKIISEFSEMYKENQVKILDIEQSINTNSEATKEAIIDFTKANKETVEGMRSSSEKMSKAAGKIEGAAEKLTSGVSAFEAKVSGVLDSLKTDLSQTISNMNENLNSVTGKLEGATDKLKITVEQMSSGIDKTLNDLSENLTNTIEKLNKDFSQNLDSVTSNLGNATDQLTNTVKNMSGSIDKTLADLKDNLGKTIESLNKDFSRNLETVTKELSGATKSISEAVGKMSGQIEKTLDDATSKQKQAFATFKTTSDALNENIVAVTNELKSYGTRISDGLAAVSDKRQEIKQITDGIVKALAHVEESGNCISGLTKNIQTSFSSQQEMLKLLTQSNEHLGSIKSIDFIPPKIFQELNLSNKHLAEMKQTLTTLYASAGEYKHEG